ncbi:MULTISPECIES: DUF3888 domain-containing protein [unclassified Paenibacillus]|uniref:DUF3888 domain-containing protein n=1 Tax=unclassified Paenibacillus TaxID=185978 RepID=UPI0024749E98|nr:MULTISPECIES: DUF3888 domain-containing protein [unclassified Paenibacillus]MDH6427240.1 hypothetical protein [Paenibacillus sp. PastH-4]MDH6443270.1 hypothetical protein [Paenibacillus sp. PastF-4]MDH6526026.1 hypothetical protein [Paenibacillus sp. PastH-3]
MKKKISVGILLSSLLLSPKISANPDDQELLCKQALLNALNPTISNAVNGYYGSPQQFGIYDAEVIKIERDQNGAFLFNVTVRVKTFTGPHNPPYGIETMTIAIDSAYPMVIDYKHQDEK